MELEDALKEKIRILEEELVLKEQAITELLDFTLEQVLEKHLKTYYRRKKVFLDTEMLVIKEFLKHVFGREMI